MGNQISKKLIEKGFVVINNCIRKDLIKEIKIQLNEYLKNILKRKKIKPSKDLTKNFYNCLNIMTQHEIQVLLARKLIEQNYVHRVLQDHRILNKLIEILGPDLEYISEFELAINVKDVKDDYLVKKYHQEFWSGTGVSTVLLWIPINLKSGMGTLELVENSHTWGHVPHRDREPINLPPNIKKKNINIKEGSLLLLSSLTLHRTVKNKIYQPRIAMPIVIRNFYYPRSGNEDLWAFKKLHFSFYSNLRKILGNTQFSPFRTLNQKRSGIFKKAKILEKKLL